MDNLSAVLHAKNDLRLENTKIPEPGDNEVQIAMHTVGICGSDVHYWVHGAIGKFIVTNPIILGHESSGTVSKLGKNVKHLKVGDRVALEPGIPCRMCEHCKEGQYNLCQDVIFCATPPYDGTLRRYYCQAADFCFKLPDNVSYEEAAFLEPLSVAVQACRRGELRVGQRVLILGAGPIGLLNMLVAKASGASTIVLTDIVDHKLAVAKELGATATINVMGKNRDAIVEEVKKCMNGDLPHVTIECTGAEVSNQLAIHATRPGGKVVLVGMGPAMVSVPLVEVEIRELDLRGVFRYANCYPTALAMVASGTVDVKPLITHRFKLEEAVQAFQTAKTGEGGAIKILIKCAED